MLREQQEQLAALEITPYGRARAFSYSVEAGAEVATRATVYDKATGKVALVDEYSGRPIIEPSVDHIVPVAEIVEMEGFDKLLLKDGTLSDDAKAVLSRTDNLRMMEKRFNLARRDTRWEDWGTGRRLYGKEGSIGCPLSRRSCAPRSSGTSWPGRHDVELQLAMRVVLHGDGRGPQPGAGSHQAIGQFGHGQRAAVLRAARHTDRLGIAGSAADGWSRVINSGGLTVLGNVTLTVPAGMAVKFNGGGIIVTGGSLVAQGTSGAPVVVSSIHDGSVAGATDTSHSPAPRPGPVRADR